MSLELRARRKPKKTRYIILEEILGWPWDVLLGIGEWVLRKIAELF